MHPSTSKRLPRAARYLASLPNGIGSYPQCKATYSLFQHFTSKPLPPESGELPEPVLQLMSSRRSAGDWIEETHLVCATLAIADHYGFSDEEWIAYSRSENERFLGSRLFRVLMSMASPRMLMMGAEMRWGSIHVGSQLKLEPATDGGVLLRLRFPKNLYPELQLRCLATGFEAALQLSKAKEGRVGLVSSDETSALFRAEWH